MTAGFAQTGPGGPDRPGPHPPRLEHPVPPPPTPTSAWPAPGVTTGSFPLPPPPMPPQARRSPVLAVLLGVLALLVVGQTVFLVVLTSQLNAANRKIDSLSANTDKRFNGLDGRTRTLEQQAANALDASAVAKA